MTKTESSKKYAYIAAICYIVPVLYTIIMWILYGRPMSPWTIIGLVAMIAMAIALFMRNKKFIMVVVGINFLLKVRETILYISFGNPAVFATYIVHNVLLVVAYAVLLVLLILTLKSNSVVKKIWFIAGAAFLISYIVNLIPHAPHLRGIISNFADVWPNIMEKVVIFTLAVAALFIGLWLKENMVLVEMPAPANPTNEYATFSPEAVYSAPTPAATIGDADRLKTYKELLDCGAITQEEFDAKKKQILGL